jgi:hypothetical protein
MKDSYNKFNKNYEVKRNFTDDSTFSVISKHYIQSTDYLRLNNKTRTFVPMYNRILYGTTVCPCAGIYKQFPLLQAITP